LIAQIENKKGKWAEEGLNRREQTIEKKSMQITQIIEINLGKRRGSRWRNQLIKLREKVRSLEMYEKI
jgi:hypothetical protein